MNGLEIMPEIPNPAQLGYMGSMKNTQDAPDGASPQTNWGRFGDTQLAHVTPGEYIVPKEVIEEYPELSQIIGQAISNLGSDPNRYIVGRSETSINPYTGQPEFFKKVFKKIKKVFKKAAPIIGAIVGNSIAPGIGTAIGSAVGTKASGGTWGQAIGAGVGTYAGGKFLSGSFGSSAIGTGATVGGQLANNGLITVANALPNFVSQANIATALGSYLGSNIGSGIGATIDPPKIKDAEPGSLANYSFESPSSQASNTNVAIPTEATSDGRPTGAGVAASSLPGATYVGKVRNRFTGMEEDVTSPNPFSNYDVSRRAGWGNISFA